MLAALLGLPGWAGAAATLDASQLSLWWVVPFAGLLLSIALMPLLAMKIWHHHFGKIALGWALLLLIPLALQFGSGTAFGLSAHTLILEYLPFIIFIGTLYVVAGGIFIKGSFQGTPLVNTTMLGIGAVLASFMGTTGASMLMISPMIRANKGRASKVHTMVFFIFIVSNAGGALTPLGDPPLFLGFLKGVDFFWTVKHMALPTLFMVTALMVMYFIIDSIFYRRDVRQGIQRSDDQHGAFGIQGGINFLLLALVVGAVLMSGLWKPGINVNIVGIDYPLQGLVRDVIFLAVAAISLIITARHVREANHFSWDPILEVAKLFFGIFITMAPVLMMLQAGEKGAFASLVRLVTDAQGQPISGMYFWMTGSLSSFLDNAPTYLVFFNLAGGDPQTLMGPMALTLTAISAGAVFMGANSYIGNAPNFMVKAIAESRGIAMPSFFGYMMWSGLILIPLFVIMSWMFF
ncbi:MAG: sodium:proton antiporter [Burkholderiales bacterium]|nr:sodium:proton antiporter [Burkholderiales bacterium]